MLFVLCYLAICCSSMDWVILYFRRQLDILLFYWLIVVWFVYYYIMLVESELSWWLSIVLHAQGRIHKISKVDRILMCWWIFTGLTHIILEGYFAFTPDFYKVNTPHYLAEVCKFIRPINGHFIVTSSGWTLTCVCFQGKSTVKATQDMLAGILLLLPLKGSQLLLRVQHVSLLCRHNAKTMFSIKFDVPVFVILIFTFAGTPLQRRSHTATYFNYLSASASYMGVLCILQRLSWRETTLQRICSITTRITSLLICGGFLSRVPLLLVAGKRYVWDAMFKNRRRAKPVKIGDLIDLCLYLFCLGKNC